MHHYIRMNGLIDALAAPRIFDLMSNLADTTRARLLLVLQDNEFTVTELCTILQLPQSTVSRHLKVLSDEDWVDSRPDGTSRRYRMAVPGLESEAAALWQLVGERASALPAARQDALRVRSVLAERRSTSQEFFASTAAGWDRLRSEMFGDRVDLTALLGLVDDRWVVGDLGCGTGRVSEALAPFVAGVVAVDVSPEMLGAAHDRLREFDNVQVRAGALESLPLDDDSLDAATLFLVLHHVDEPWRVLSEAARVLRPGGRLVIADMTPHDRRAYQNDMGHVWLGFSSAQLRDWLAAAGFERTTYHPLAPDPEASGPAIFTASARLAQAS
jgi:ArsR family transcriptional regulator